MSAEYIREVGKLTTKIEQFNPSMKIQESKMLKGFRGAVVFYRKKHVKRSGSIIYLKDSDDAHIAFDFFLTKMRFALAHGSVDSDNGPTISQFAASIWDSLQDMREHRDLTDSQRSISEVLQSKGLLLATPVLANYVRKRDFTKGYQTLAAAWTRLGMRTSFFNQNAYRWFDPDLKE